MKRWHVVALVLLVVGLIGSTIKPSEEFRRKYPRDGLTEEQYQSIRLDCAAHPDVLRCR
jgi:hypothetical protein